MLDAFANLSRLKLWQRNWCKPTRSWLVAVNKWNFVSCKLHNMAYVTCDIYSLHICVHLRGCNMRVIYILSLCATYPDIILVSLYEKHSCVIIDINISLHVCRIPDTQCGIEWTTPKLSNRTHTKNSLPGLEILSKTLQIFTKDKPRSTKARKMLALIPSP